MSRMLSTNSAACEALVMNIDGPAPYQTVFLDWRGTICTSLFWEQWADDPASCHLIPRLQSALWSSRRLVRRWMRGQMSAEEVIAEIAPQMGISPARLLHDLQVSCEQMVIAPGIADACRDLCERGVSVVIATDNMDTFGRWTVPRLGLGVIVDDILDSSVLGALKEDTAPDGSSLFFSAYIGAAGLGRRMLLIDDRSEALLVQRFGIDVAIVQYPAETLVLLQRLAPPIC